MLALMSIYPFFALDNRPLDEGVSDRDLAQPTLMGGQFFPIIDEGRAADGGSILELEAPRLKLVW
jgi:hypothetical protein